MNLNKKLDYLIADASSISNLAGTILDHKLVVEVETFAHLAEAKSQIASAMLHQNAAIKEHGRAVDSLISGNAAEFQRHEEEYVKQTLESVDCASKWADQIVADETLATTCEQAFAELAESDIEFGLRNQDGLFGVVDKIRIFSRVAERCAKDIRDKTEEIVDQIKNKKNVVVNAFADFWGYSSETREAKHSRSTSIYVILEGSRTPSAHDDSGKNNAARSAALAYEQALEAAIYKGDIDGLISAIDQYGNPGMAMAGLDENLDMRENMMDLLITIANSVTLFGSDGDAVTRLLSNMHQVANILDEHNVCRTKPKTPSRPSGRTWRDPGYDRETMARKDMKIGFNEHHIRLKKENYSDIVSKAKRLTKSKGWIATMRDADTEKGSYAGTVVDRNAGFCILNTGSDQLVIVPADMVVGHMEKGVEIDILFENGVGHESRRARNRMKP